MIKVVAKFTIKEGMADMLLAAVPHLIAETKKEAGYIAYDLYQDILAPNTFAMIEEWENQEALNKHLNSKHFLDFQPLMSQVSEKEEINLLKTVF